ncbi:MAG TPA: adenylate/guanylate cyclase domain-containing protein [Candidatus Eisenbacteria bacterium]|nr:adenylate/guanylate cyclase domain-containing protein [Candidatus Eisenbacteria bacterium]
MSGLTRQEVAERADVEVAYVDQLLAVAVLTPDSAGSLTADDVKRAGIMRSLQDAGLPLDGIANGLRQGVLSLDFVTSVEYSRFTGISDETFEAASVRTGVPLPLLTMIREAIGLGSANPKDRLREHELAVIPFVQMQLRMGFRPAAIERFLRALGDSLRRIAESESEWWRTEVIEPRLAAGVDPSLVGQPEGSADLTRVSDEALMAIYHAQQQQTWTSNIAAGFEALLARAGLYEAPDRPPAICFLDITGYTRLTQERGDRAAAELAELLTPIVKRTSIEHGGRPVKWLGDGVMIWFRDPGPAVVAALEMVDALDRAGLPPAHVGIHSGPVVVQQGDYYGQTVNMASRIADYARPGEVLVSQTVVNAASVGGVTFTDIGAVELKGVAGAVGLHAARRAG